MTSMWRSRPSLAVLDHDGAVGDQVADQLVEHAGHADRRLAGADHEDAAPHAVEVDYSVADPERVALAAQSRAQRALGVDRGECGGGDRERIGAQAPPAVRGQLAMVDEPAVSRDSHLIRSHPRSP